MLALVRGPLRAAEEWCGFAEEALFTAVFARAARTQLTWPLSLVGPSMARKVVMARLQAGGWDDARVREEATQAYAALEALVGPLELLLQQGSGGGTASEGAAGAGAAGGDDARAPGTPGSPQLLLSPGSPRQGLGETLPGGRRRTLAPPVLSELQLRMAAAATPLRPEGGPGVAGDTERLAAGVPGPAPEQPPPPSPSPSWDGPFLLGAARPSSADLALYAHLHAVAVRHGPPAAWVARSAPGLVGYYAMMDGLLRATREGAAGEGAGARSASPPSPNEFELVAAAIDRRCGLLAHYEQASPPASADGSGGSTATGDSSSAAAAGLAGGAALPSDAILAAAGRWGYDPQLVSAASVDALTTGRGPAKLVQDAVVTAGIFAAALVLMRAVVASRSAA